MEISHGLDRIQPGSFKTGENLDKAMPKPDRGWEIYLLHVGGMENFHLLGE